MKKVLMSDGRTLKLEPAFQTDLPPKAYGRNDYTQYWVARSEHSNEVIFYLAKGYKIVEPNAKRQIVVWYRNGYMWSGFGLTLETAIEGAVKDAYLCATVKS